MKRLLVNITWLFMAIPFYIIIFLCFAYSKLLNLIFDKIGNQEPYKFIEVLDSMVYKLNTKL